MGCGGSSQTVAGTQSDQPQQRQQGTSSPKTKQQDDGASSDFLENGIKAHNQLRVKHGAAPLTPSADLTKFSQKWAQQLAKKDSMEHSTNKMRDAECGGAGENLYCCWSSDPSAGVSAKDAVQSWYDEIKDYDFNNPGFAMATGHFTQVVWKGSKELGMAWAVSKKGTYYVVANYRPAGNYQGQFQDEVVPAK